MDGVLNTAEMQAIIDRFIDNRLVHGIQLSVVKGDEEWSGCSGELVGLRPFFITSVTKMFISAIILKWESEKVISLDDRISGYLSDYVVMGLHHLKGRFYSSEITIGQLLSHTSGLPDYFDDRLVNGMTLSRALKEGIDQAWNFDQVIEMAKTMKAKFIPGEQGRAFYSDTNFQLLGRIIENISQTDIGHVLDESIFKPLGMNSTYLFSDPDDNIPAPVYSGDKPLRIPKAMTSFVSDGGIVSTSSDLMIFLRAFFSGKLFPIGNPEDFSQWNKIKNSVYYGNGIIKTRDIRIKLPYAPEQIFYGHSGISGSFAWYLPGSGIFLTGTVNQILKNNQSFRLIRNILKSIS
jgi:D-alanyl-D-alanine carboxypeptidase